LSRRTLSVLLAAVGRHWTCQPVVINSRLWPSQRVRIAAVVPPDAQHKLPNRLAGKRAGRAGGRTLITQFWRSAYGG
jgi:hypothetical protein